MTVNVTKPQINLRDKISEVDKPSGIAGEAILRSETPQEVFNYINAGRRNLIINGAMQVAQRGTSATGQTTNAYVALDRWRTEASGATYNVSQQAMSSADLEATGFANFLRMEVTTGNDNAGVAQKVEASSIRQFKGQKLTASFYAKGTNPNGGSFTLSRFFFDGSSASTAETTSFSITSTWQKYTITFDYPSEGSTDLTTASAYMSLSFLQPEGDASTNAWTLDITGVQLEVGKVATPFEHRSYGEELALCQRYYYKILNESGAVDDAWFGTGFNYATTNAAVTVHFPVDMRIAPTAIETTGTATDYRVWHSSNVNTNCSAVPSYAGSTRSTARVLFSVASGLTIGQGMMGRANALDSFLAWSAEL